MAVLRPLKVVLTNYPEGQVEEVDVINNPEDPAAGTRKVPFARVLYIERDDFKEDPPKKFFRLSPGKEVRLRCAYFITCTEVIKDDRGEVVELRATYDPATRGGDAPDGRRVKATLHWVSAAHALPIEVRLYDRLFSVEDPEKVGEGQTFLDHINPASLDVLHGCLAEPSLATAVAPARFQFERIGYFCVDPDSRPGKLVVNRTVSLRDAWAKIEQKQADAFRRPSTTGPTRHGPPAPSARSRSASLKLRRPYVCSVSAPPVRCAARRGPPPGLPARRARSCQMGA